MNDRIHALMEYGRLLNLLGGNTVLHKEIVELVNELRKELGLKK